MRDKTKNKKKSVNGIKKKTMMKEMLDGTKKNLNKPCCLVTILENPISKTVFYGQFVKTVK